MPEQPIAAPLSPDELEIWASLATVLERLPAALDAQLQRDSGLTHFEHGILFALDSAPERTLRLSVLATYASCTLSRLSRAISRLEAKGWVRREIDPTDGRFTLGVLTPAGHDKVAESTPAHQALVRRVVFDTLTPAQARQLRTVSTKIASAIDPAESWHPPAAG
ncbi:MarR family winged helix-turn-helix transcriptional regulator [Microbacterium nymphoidis]|uniref:MarR family winged helix-turn-helix transcriptional regulator n=1 Tax=Microbacterium nymphoidis TaxID=2898586 RepID=UPI001E429BDB|nr:MarR family winged helix-turn-helix transcriptional regulator [Microbacterium nymphoidis]MCD2497880.1 MarR family winged helix-turn-helix transcriptional regulator [Microbacterium nymphoidis]